MIWDAGMGPNGGGIVVTVQHGNWGDWSLWESGVVWKIVVMVWIHEVCFGEDALVVFIVICKTGLRGCSCGVISSDFWGINIYLFFVFVIVFFCT